MNKFFQNLKYCFLNFKQKSKQDMLKTTFNIKGSKLILGEGANVTINAQTRKNIDQVRDSVTSIVKQAQGDTKKLLEYVQSCSTPVYIIDNADKILALVKEEEGIIFEQKGLKALYLSIITGQGIKFQTPAMFILRDGLIDRNYFLHHFYRWYSMKSNLPGFDYETQKKFKKYLIFNTTEDTKKLNIEDIMEIEEAITRDQEATSFVLEYMKQNEGSKNVINKIKSDGSANV